MDSKEIVVRLQELSESCEDDGQVTCELAGKQIELLEAQAGNLSVVDETALVVALVSRALSDNLSPGSLGMIRAATKQKRAPKKAAEAE